MVAATSPDRPATNPYVGPRAFKTGERLYGRSREASELVDLLIAERIVLLYSPSGAGKSSLINAMIIPKMQEEGFIVTPTVRVNLDPPPEAASQPGFNRYTSSMMRSLEDQIPSEAQYPAGELAGMSLAAYMKEYRQRSSVNPEEADPQAAVLLIIDQFEEVLRVSGADQEVKKAFFAQLGDALRDRSIWALIAIREDYLAAIQQYSRPIPNRLDVTYQLDFLDRRAAIEAIQGPAKESGVLFEDDAAAKLVDDLRVIRVQQADGTATEEHGPYVEPVQLQVVCRRLWDKAAEKKVVTLQDVQDAGNIDDALSDYYDEHVTEAATDSGVPERQIREWVDRKLITVSGIRGQVLMEPDVSGGLPNKAIKFLQEAYLVRADKRGNAIWFELAHDRLTRPIRRNNASWFADHLSVFQRQADLWLNQERKEALLLRGTAYLEAEAWVKEHPDEILPGEREFLEASHREHQRLMRARRLNTIVRFAAIGMTLLAIAAVGFFLRASRAEQKANDALILAQDSARIAEQERARAEDNAARAEQKEQEAVRLGRVAEIRSLVAQSVQNLAIDPAVSVLLARQAAALGDPEDPEMQDAVKAAEDALRQALPSMRVERILTDASISSGSLVSHALPVFSAAFDPIRSRQRVITGGGDGTIKIWDTSNGALLHIIPVYEGVHSGQIVTSVAFSPNGELLAAAISDGRILIFDSVSFEPVNTIPAEQGMIWSIAFSPDSQTLAGGGEDGLSLSGGGLATLWNVVTSEILFQLKEHTADIRAIAFNSRGDQIATGDANGTVRVWFTATGTVRIRPPGGHIGAVNDLAFSPNGLILATSGGEDRNIILWDLTENGRRLRTISGHREGVNAIVFTADSQNLISASSDRTVRFWETDTGRPGLVLYGHKEPILDLALSPDGRRIVTASRDKTARIWNISPEGSSEVRTIDEETDIYAVAVSPDGGQVASAGENSIVHVRNPRSGALVLTLKGHDRRVTGVVYSRDSKRMATSSLDGTARIWDATSGQSLHSFGEGRSGLWGIAFSPDGSRISTAAEDGTVKVWNAETGDVLSEMISEWGPARTLAFTPTDGSILAAGYAGGQVVLWNPHSGDLVKVLGSHGDQVNAVAFRPDGNVLASASTDGNIILWDMNETNRGDSEPPLRDRGDAIFALTFTPDGKFLFSGGADGVGDLWDLQDRHVDFRTYGHSDRIYGVAISTDHNGQPEFLYTGGRDDTLRSYVFTFEQIKKLAEDRAPRIFSPEECRQYLNAACPAELAAEMPLIPVTGGGPLASANLKRPGDVPRISRPDAKDTSTSKIGTDAYYVNVLERPFSDSKGSIYYPDIDLASATRGEDQEWLYFTITLADLRGEGLTGNYAVELDTDGNGSGDYLIETLVPGADWSTSGVRIWQDKNKDVGNGDPNTNNPPQKGDGYESLLFDRGSGDAPDLAWSRISPDDQKSVQIALQRSILGRRSSYIWFAWASRDPFKPAWFEYLDHFAVMPGVAPPVDLQGNPLQELAGVDNTCRVVVGSEPPPGEGYCR